MHVYVLVDLYQVKKMYSKPTFFAVFSLVVFYIRIVALQHRQRSATPCQTIPSCILVFPDEYAACVCFCSTLCSATMCGETPRSWTPLSNNEYSIFLAHCLFFSHSFRWLSFRKVWEKAWTRAFRTTLFLLRSFKPTKNYLFLSSAPQTCLVEGVLKLYPLHEILLGVHSTFQFLVNDWLVKMDTPSWLKVFFKQHENSGENGRKGATKTTVETRRPLKREWHNVPSKHPQHAPRLC